MQSSEKTFSIISAQFKSNNFHRVHPHCCEEAKNIKSFSSAKVNAQKLILY